MYYKGNIIQFEYNNEFDTYRFLDGRSHYVDNGVDFCFHTFNYEELENIELDDTTMKRIAQFNKEQECKRLDKEIKEKQERIKELDDLLMDKEKRWNKVKEFIKQVYEIEDIDDLDEEDDDYDFQKRI